MKRGIKTLIALVLLYLVYLVVKVFFLRRLFNDSRKKAEAMKGPAKGAQGANKSARPRTDAEETAVDPVCGNYVPLNSAVTADASGRRVYFCSCACRDAFMSAEKRRAL